MCTRVGQRILLNLCANSYVMEISQGKKENEDPVRNNPSLFNLKMSALHNDSRNLRTVVFILGMRLGKSKIFLFTKGILKVENIHGDMFPTG